MRYLVAVEKEPGSDYGVSVPDFPGCISAGSTMEEALTLVQEAISLHLEAMADNGDIAPAPTDVDMWLDDPDYQDVRWAYVELDVSAYSGKTEKTTITLPSILVKKMDDLIAQRRIKNRSAFLADSASKALNSIK